MRNSVNDGSITNIIQIKENCTKISSYPDEFKHNDKVRFTSKNIYKTYFCSKKFSNFQLFDVSIERNIETNYKINNENKIVQSIESIEIIKFSYELEKSLNKKIKSRYKSFTYKGLKSFIK
jgi:hypothetical protein